MPDLTNSTTQTKLNYLKLMFLSREGDRREGILLRQSKGWFQVGGLGHEALCALMTPLTPDDWIFPCYRDRAQMLARGITNYEIALAYFAKKDSSSGGRQMPGHFSSRKHNVFSVPTPVGSNLLPACGVAWGMKLNHQPSVCVATIGDAATRQGEFYEAFAFAVQEKLPVIFVVEDNKYGISTSTKHFYPYALGGILSDEHLVKVNGRYVLEVEKATKEATQKAKKGDGPTILWCDIDRIGSHTSSDDQRVYRSAADIEEMQKRDPILLLAEELIANGELTASAWEEIQQQIIAQVDEDYKRAEKEEDPSASDLMKHSFGETLNVEAPPINSGELTMVEMINQTLHKAVEQDPEVIFFGEDIEDPKGGVFGLTKGLKNAAPKNTYNSPLAEATIMGLAVGLAIYGKKPVFELQFIDFITPGWNQISTNMSTLRWRTFGDWKCPLVIYAPYGAYLPGGGLWHSQSNESSIAHLPGIHLAILSTPEDAAGLLWSAVHSDDPAFILIPKHLFRKRSKVSKIEPVPFGKAKILHEGTDVTLVSWGNTIELIEEAATELAGECSIEIIDLRSIAPCDYETITTSVQKTGRLVVVQEDVRTCGFGQAILSEFTSQVERFNLLLAAPQLVSREDVAIGFNPIYEYAALPDVPRIVAAIRTTLE